MKRLNVRFDNETFEKLEARTKEKRCGSVVNSVRELVDLGLKIEDSAKQKNSDDSSDELTFLVDVMKTTLKFSLENLLIARQTISQMNTENDLAVDEILKKCKEQAQSHIKKFFPEEEKS